MILYEHYNIVKPSSNFMIVHLLSLWFKPPKTQLGIQLKFTKFFSTALQGGTPVYDSKVGFLA